MKKRIVTFLSALLLIGILFNIGSTISGKWKDYTEFNFWERLPGLHKIYIESQYVNKNPKGWVPDELINAYAGGEYIKGTSPILIAPDTPPLGRYLIGLSALLFNNEHIIILFVSVVSLVFLYLLGKQIFVYPLTTLGALFFITWEPIFKNQLIYTPLLDIMQLMFLAGGFYFFNRAFQSKKYLYWYILVSVFLGLFISTKFFATGITILAAYYLVLFFNRDKKRIFAFSFTAPLSVLVLLLTYIRVLMLGGYTIFQFIGIQKWVYLYHKSQLILPFTIWPLILFNKWYVWYGDNPIISDPQWRITWPIALIGSLIITILYFLRKLPKKKPVEILMLWAILYILFFSIGQVTARYLVIYIPILYLILFFGIERLFISYFKK